MNELKYPYREILPIIPCPAGLLTEALIIFKEPGLYRLRIGWRRALFSPLTPYDQPDLDSEDYSYVQNTHPEYKAVFVAMPCSMLVRQWEFVDDAQDLTEENAIGKEYQIVDKFGMRDYREPDYHAIAAELMAVDEAIRKAQSIKEKAN